MSDERKEVTWFDHYLTEPSRDPQWQVDGIWSYKSHGIWAGEAKTRKSYLACDFAVSVASGTPFLDHFPVTRKGPVLMIQEELSDSELRKRLRRIALSKGLGLKVEKTEDGRLYVEFPSHLPLYLRNREQFNLQNEDDLKTLQQDIEEWGIQLVVLDPLGLMLGTADENHAAQVRPILNNLLEIKERTGAGILLVHHFAKSSATNPRTPGQRMLGSQAFHGWVESALYIEKPDAYVAQVTREFRNHPVSPETFTVEYVGGEDEYQVIVEERKERKRKGPTAFEKYCLKNVGQSLRKIHTGYGISLKAAQARIEQSNYVELGTRKLKATGRPAQTVENKKKTVLTDVPNKTAVK